jgi:serine/threonine protein kinase
VGAVGALPWTLPYRPRSLVRGKAGTPGFWAPEMIARGPDGRTTPYDGGADFWSLGCLLYALLN